MPGVIMENGSRNGLHTNHERDQRQNGVNGTSQQLEKVQDKPKGRSEPLQNVTPVSPSLPNGLNGRFSETSRQRTSNGEERPLPTQSPLNDLPPEILHITEGYIALSKLLQRLSQKTFLDMESTFADLAEMPAPTSTTNGYGSSGTDDTSQENLNKKLRLLKFLEGAHGDWAKGLAIAEWSRNAAIISKLIDLQQNLREKKQFFNQSIDILCEYKRGLLGARLPNPDLRTAVEILTTGKASWMPDLGYIPPPALSAAEILKNLKNLDTLLSIRMNLHEYDNLPYHFKDYIISSGRVTFMVVGEFEVDLAIASEDPEIQFWFIDLRFTFSPQPAPMDSTLRFHLEQQINDVLGREGLSGCYKFLHEMVLTRKILEMRRQTAELARGRWIDGLKLEQLNRTLSIQYWVDRYSKGPKSWILLGVHSGKPDHGRFDPKATSRLSIRWFRDGKEVNDEKITFDMINLSAEELLNAVTARHTSHILASVCVAMQSHDLFAQQELIINPRISAVELDIRLTHALRISIKIEPATGRFVFSPASQRVTEYENRLNSLSSDPAKDASGYLENLRYVSLVDEIHRHGSSLGWTRVANPGLSGDTLKSIMPKETAHMAWFSRSSWPKNWVLAISFSMKGEKWWLMQSEEIPKDPKSFKELKPKDAKTQIPRKITRTIRIPIKSASPIPTYKFMSTLNVFVAALLSGFSNTHTLHSQRVTPVLRLGQKPSKGIALPSIYARLSEMLPSKNVSARTRRPWARDIVRITFQGLEVKPSTRPQLVQQGISPAQQLIPAEESALVVTEARMVVPISTSMTGLNELVDRDIAWHAPSGSIAFKIKSRVGESIITPFIERAIRVERLVDYVQVLKTHHKALKCESMSLGKISFSYAAHPSETIPSSSAQNYLAEIDFGVAKDIKLDLKTDRDPLVRIVDFLTMILNDSKHGFNAVATFMTLTLPLLRGLDAIEASWINLSEEEEQTYCFILARAVDWYIIRFAFTQQPVPGSGSSPTLRKVAFEVKLNSRKAEPYWYIQRVDNQDATGLDDMDVALKPLWNASGEEWLGMRLSAVATPSAVESLLSRLDSIVRDVASSPYSVPAAAPSAVVPNTTQAVAKPPSRPQPPNQQRQQGNQRQPPNQNQGRMNSSSKVIEID